MKIKNFELIMPKDPSTDEGTVTTSCSNRWALPLQNPHEGYLPLEISHIITLDKCFLQSSMILNMESNKAQKTSNFAHLSKMLSPIYNADHVIRMKPITESERSELKSRLLTIDVFDKSFDKTKSYLNLFTKSNQGDTVFKPPKNHKNSGLISKIFQSSKTSKFHLFKYNTVKDESTNIILDSFFVNRSPFRKFSMEKNSGYSFIYDNRGTISVISDLVKICELTLPDSRADPTLYVQEIDYNKFLLFVAGGLLIKAGGSPAPTDSIAVFFLNFKDTSRLIFMNEPLLYVKMKYCRMYPILLTHKTAENGLMLMIIGGNIRKKFKEEKSPLEKGKKKSSVWMFSEGNMMCETISIETIKNSIHQANGESVPLISTEDCLCLIVNGKESEIKSKSLRYYLGNAAILQIKDRKKHKISFIFGLGKHRNEIWYIDMFDFIEHKAYIYQSQSCLPKNRNRMLCNSMLTKVGDEIYYLDDDETNVYRKLSIKKLKVNVALSVCNIF